ncbi:MAG: magnesium/cobalt transporter CorA [Nitrospirae bacterium]|nr:magnesium/cobalt transporter CorA [Nitrospirota bacterium]
MARTIKRRSKKAGLPPGTLVHIGERKVEKASVTCMVFDSETITESDISGLDACIPYKDRKTVTWINVVGLHQVEVLEKVGHCFGLHPLVLEDILNTDQRPKMEDYGDYIYIVLRMLENKGNVNGSGVMSEQVSIILGPNFVISLQERPDDEFDPVRDRLRGNKGRIRKMGADFLAYTLIDLVVDNYFAVLESLGETIEDIEDALVADPTPATVHSIHRMKREMIYLRKSVWPLREVISGLQRADTALVQPGTVIYLRDVYDHTIQAMDTVETYRDMLSGMLDIYLSSISNRMNEVMKVLTVIATIFIPLTFLVGVYGMNFRYMPELDFHWGYPALWLVMLAIVGGMLVYFRRKKWL